MDQCIKRRAHSHEEQLKARTRANNKLNPHNAKSGNRTQFEHVFLKSKCTGIVSCRNN